MSEVGNTNARRRHSDATFSIVAAPSNSSSIALKLAEGRLGRVVDERGDLHERDPRTHAVQAGDAFGELVGEERSRGGLRVPHVEVQGSLMGFVRREDL